MDHTPSRINTTDSESYECISCTMHEMDLTRPKNKTIKAKQIVYLYTKDISGSMPTINNKPAK